jgi:hypothetical protein
LRPAGALARLLLALAAVLAACRPASPTPLVVTPPPGASATAGLTPAPPPTVAATDTPQASATPEPSATPTNTPTATPIADPLELARTFRAARALEHIAELASERYAGRRAGTAGGEAAAAYIAAEFARLGLQPAGADGGYLQPFELPFLELATPPELAIAARPGVTGTQYVHMQDFRELVVAGAGPGRVDAPAAYVAGGFASDYAGLDVSGRVVVIDAALRVENSSLIRAFETAFGEGAAAVLILTPDDQGLDVRPSYRAPLPDQTRPVFLVTRRFGDELAAAGGTTLGESAQLIDVEVHVAMELLPEQTVTTANVLGLWPGSDPAQAGEYVLIGGHYDHVGQLPSGAVFPGASDNASGIAVMLALAESWQTGGYRPPFSVVFVGWGAEEAGLVGSSFYVEHPTLPLADTRAFINLDALGQGDGDGLTVLYERDQSLATQLQAAAFALGHELPAEQGGASDHVPFASVGVPSALLIGAGRLSTLHRMSDTPATVEEENVRQAGEIAWLAVLQMAPVPVP